MEQTKILIPADVLEGLEAVRLSGKINMLDVHVVIRLALEMGFPEAAFWVEARTPLYVVGIFSGFHALEGGDERLDHLGIQQAERD